MRSQCFFIVTHSQPAPRVGDACFLRRRWLEGLRLVFFVLIRDLASLQFRGLFVHVCL